MEGRYKEGKAISFANVVFHLESYIAFSFDNTCVWYWWRCFSLVVKMGVKWVTWDFAFNLVWHRNDRQTRLNPLF